MPVFRSIFFLSLIRLFRPRSRAQGGTLAPGFYPVFGGTYSLKTHRLPGWSKISIRPPRLRHRKANCGRNSLRPLRLRPLLRLAVHFQIYLLIVEAEMVLYAGGSRYGARVIPDECFLDLTTSLHRVVGRS